MTDTITVTGYVATEPRHLVTAAGLSITTFRLASNLRRLDHKLGTWVDAGTNWYSVSAYRGLAETVANSIKQRDPVVVVGRLRIHDWDNGVKTGINVDLDADTIGHNLRWGTTVFTRTIRSTSTSDLDPGEVAGDDESGPDWTSNDGGQPSDEAESVAEPATERSEVVVPF
ncbi:MAG: single-stranded DNA-binding protein [Terrimesophilobacter sp.]